KPDNCVNSSSRGSLLRAAVVFLVRHRFEPHYTAGTSSIGDRDVIHLAIRRRAVPVLNVGRANDRLASVDRLHRLSSFLITPAAADHNESLARRMFVPVASCTRLKGHAANRIIIALGFLREHLQIHGAGEIIGWSLFAFWKNELAICF